jgi:hypothetical protein
VPLRHELQRAPDRVGHFLGRLHRIAGHVDHAHHHVLAFEQRHQLRRHVRVDALQAHLVDAARGQRGKHLLVLAPLLAQRLLPLDVGRDAVAVADVHRRLAAEAFGRALQRLHAPIGRLVEVDVERRLVELHDVHAVSLQRPRFLVQQLRESEGQLHPVAIVAVGHRVDDRHRAGQRELDALVRVGAQQLGLRLVHAARQAQRRHHLRHHRLVAVVADAHLDLVLEVDAGHLLEEAVHEVLTALLAVADHVEPRVLLRLDPQQGGVELGLREFGAFGLPARPELFGFGEPGGLGQAAGNGGVEHGEPPGP